MSVVVARSHAGWWPHKSGYRDDHPLQEYDVSRDVNALILKAEKRIAFDEVFMHDRYMCDGSCVVGHDTPLKRIQPKKLCEKYLRGIRSKTTKTTTQALAVAFHIDNAPKVRGGEAPSGPYCLTSGGAIAHGWSFAFLRKLEDLSGFKRRYRARIGGQRWNGVLDDTHPAVEALFGFKWFLRKGNPEAVVVELGNIQSTIDVEWLTDGQGKQQAAEAALWATEHVFGTPARED